MILWITIILVCITLVIYIYYSQYVCKIKTSYDVFKEIRDNYNMEQITLEPNILDKYKTIIHNKNQLFIICDEPINIELILWILSTMRLIHYICWISTKDFNETILNLLIYTHRDTFIGLLNIDNQFSDNFLVVQKSIFTLHFLTYMKTYRNKWNSKLKKMIDIKHINNIIYTSFFTIHFNNLNCISCVYYNLVNRKGDSSLPPIIQTWASHFTNQDRFILCYNELNRIYPKHTYKLFSDFEMKQFILSYYDENICKQYDNIIPIAFKSDFFRYLYLYKFGGFYLDIPVLPLVNIFEYISLRYPHKKISFLSAIDNGHPNNIWNAFMYVVPNHPIMKECIDEIMSYQNKKVFKSCLDYTGPGVLGKVLKKYKNNDDILLFYHDAKQTLILDGEQQLFATKSNKKDKNGINITTKTMYTENKKIHYSFHCLYHKIFYQ
jgi:mannosyltransferase OCH1-like enzyme